MRHFQLFGLIKVVNVDTVKNVAYVMRLRDKREFGPFKHTDLVEVTQEEEEEQPRDFEVSLLTRDIYLLVLFSLLSLHCTYNSVSALTG